jgi:hypothetical protein
MVRLIQFIVFLKNLVYTYLGVQIVYTYLGVQIRTIPSNTTVFNFFLTPHVSIDDRQASLQILKNEVNCYYF